MRTIAMLNVIMLSVLAPHWVTCFDKVLIKVISENTIDVDQSYVYLGSLGFVAE
jgi:hypothetical protein